MLTVFGSRIWEMTYRPHLIYLLGLFLISLLIGLAVGLSKSPVVATYIPLIFGLIAGAGGLFLPNLEKKIQAVKLNDTREQPEDKDINGNDAPNDKSTSGAATKIFPRNIFETVGAALIVIALGSGGGMLYGMLIRENLTFADLVPRTDPDNLEIPQDTSLDAQALVELAILDRVLESAGIKTTVREIIRNRFMNNDTKQSSTYQILAVKLSAQLARLSEQLETKNSGVSIAEGVDWANANRVVKGTLDMLANPATEKSSLENQLIAFRKVRKANGEVLRKSEAAIFNDFLLSEKDFIDLIAARTPTSSLGDSVDRVVKLLPEAAKTIFKGGSSGLESLD